MKDLYLRKVEKILKQAYPDLACKYRLEFKNVFGAVGGYVNDRIFISCGRFGVALRLPPETLDKLFNEKGVKHLKYFPKGHIKKEYAVIPKRILDDTDRFKKLLNSSISFLLSL